MLVLIVVGALVVSTDIGQAPGDTDVAGNGVAVPGAPDQPVATIAAPGPSPGTGVGATPLDDARIECSRSDDVAAATCVSWAVRLDRFPTTGAAVAGDHVAVGARPDVVGLDVRTGEARWRTEVGRVTGVVGAQGGTHFVVWTDVGDLLVLDGSDGRVVWRAAGSVRVVDAALLQGWVVAAIDSGVRGWPIDGHAKEWQVDVSGQPSPLGVGNGVVAVGDGQGDVRYIDVDTGSVRWSVRADTWFVTVTPDNGLVLSGGFGSPLRALDTRAGGIVWEAPEVTGWVGTEVLPGEDRAVAQVGDDATLFLVDLGSGTLLAEERDLGDLLGTTIDAWALVRSDGRVLAYDAQRADGSIGWEVRLDGEPVGVPTLVDAGAGAPLLVVVTTDGRVVATPVPPRVP